MFYVFAVPGLIAAIFFVIAAANRKIIPRMSSGNKLIFAGLGLFLFVIGTFYAPGSDTPPTSTVVEPEASAEPTEEPPTPEIRQAATNVETAVGNFAITVKGAEVTNKLTSDYSEETTEDQFVVIGVTIKNGDDRPRDVSASMFTLVDGDGKTYEAYDASIQGALIYETINPGLTRTRYVVFETPAGISGLKLRADGGVLLASDETVEFTL